MKKVILHIFVRMPQAFFLMFYTDGQFENKNVILVPVFCDSLKY